VSNWQGGGGEEDGREQAPSVMSTRCQCVTYWQNVRALLWVYICKYHVADVKAVHNCHIRSFEGRLNVTGTRHRPHSKILVKGVIEARIVPILPILTTQKISFSSYYKYITSVKG
jgi:hypothetical protein